MSTDSHEQVARDPDSEAPSPEKQTAPADFRSAFEGIRWRRWIWVGLLLLVVGYAGSGIFVVNPGEVAVVRRFGAVVHPRVTEGLHYRLPWPLDRADLVSVSEVRRVSVGVASAEGQELVMEALSGDTNIIDFEVIVQYQVNDPAAYLFSGNYQASDLVGDVAREATTRIAAKTAVDDILTTERPALQNLIRKELQANLDAYESGLVVIDVNLQKAFPAAQVADAFTDVASAKEDKANAINEAQGYANSLIPEARGKAQEILSQAQSYHESTIRGAEGEAAAFKSVLAEFAVNRQIYGQEITLYQLYLETMEKILPRVTIYVVTSQDGSIRLRLLAP